MSASSGSNRPSPTRSSPRVLVFDSGVGGLSVAREIQRRLPWLSLVYASDNGFFPYGTKPEEALISRVETVMAALLDVHPVDIAVIACNTASTLTLPHLRQRFDIPFVGVVPAIKPAAQNSKSRVIGLLATPATVARPYTHNLIQTHAADCTVISVGSSELVELAERKLRGEKISDSDITPITQAFMEADGSRSLDHLVLACTHFPLLAEELKRNLPERVKLVDSGEAIARRVEFLLQEAGLLKPAAKAPEHLSLFTQANTQVKLLEGALANFGIHAMDFLSI